MIGAEKAHCLTYPAEEANAAHQTGEDLDPTSAEENEESAESSNPRVMEKFAISETGSAKVLFHPFLNKNEVHEKGVVHAQMMAPRQKDSEIADHLQLHGVRDVHKDRKMAAQDHHDVSSRNGLLLSVLPLPLSRIVNGVLRCDPMHLLPNLLSHLAMVAHLLHQHPPLLFLLADPG